MENRGDYCGILIRRQAMYCECCDQGDNDDDVVIIMTLRMAIKMTIVSSL